jgi:hypothetical protein
VHLCRSEEARRVKAHASLQQRQQKQQLQQQRAPPAAPGGGVDDSGDQNLTVVLESSDAEGAIGVSEEEEAGGGESDDDDVNLAAVPRATSSSSSSGGDSGGGGGGGSDRRSRPNRPESARGRTRSAIPAAAAASASAHASATPAAASATDPAPSSQSPAPLVKRGESFRDLSSGHVTRSDARALLPHGQQAAARAQAGGGSGRRGSIGAIRSRQLPAPRITFTAGLAGPDGLDAFVKVRVCVRCCFGARSFTRQSAHPRPLQTVLADTPTQQSGDTSGLGYTLPHVRTIGAPALASVPAKAALAAMALPRPAPEYSLARRLGLPVTSLVAARSRAGGVGEY